MIHCHRKVPYCHVHHNMIIHGTFVIKHSNFVSLNEHSFILISFKQRICDVNRFEFVRISSKDFTIKNSKW